MTTYRSAHAVDQVDVFRETCRAYLNGTGDNSLRVVHNLKRPILDQVLELLEGKDLQLVQVISPFFDAELSPLKHFSQRFPLSRFEFFIQQAKTNFPKHAYSSLGSQASLYLYQDIDRYLHGKALILHADSEIWLLMGSANFTSAALMGDGQSSNLEFCLLGRIDQTTVEALLHPLGQEAVQVVDLDQVNAQSGPVFVPSKRQWVEYIGEAVLQDGTVSIRRNSLAPSDEFNPTEFVLRDFYGHTAIGKVDSSLTVELSASIREQVSGKLSVHLIGKDRLGNERQSNSVWVIELEEASIDPTRARLRRIRNDPASLFEILKEIAEEGNEQELRLFLSHFDIPLDLFLPPHFQTRPRSFKSKGNVEGELPARSLPKFGDSILNALDTCLERHYEKLKKHNQELQPSKLGNFILIFGELLILNDFVSAWLVEKNLSDSPVTAREWEITREAFDLLLHYLKKIWSLVWSENGYANGIDAKLAAKTVYESDLPDQDAPEGYPTNEEVAALTFRQELYQGYDDSVEELMEFALRPVASFRRMKSKLKIRTVTGTIVKARVFPHGFSHITDEGLAEIEALVSQTS